MELQTSFTEGEPYLQSMKVGFECEEGAANNADMIVLYSIECCKQRLVPQIQRHKTPYLWQHGSTLNLSSNQLVQGLSSEHR